MKMRTYLKVALPGLLVLGFFAQATAEVSVQTDRRGRYLGTSVVTAGTADNPQPWGTATSSGRSRSARSGATLNLSGDRIGDGWPVVVEQPTAPHFPWVIWSRSNGADYDVVFSRWTTWGWMPIEWLPNRPQPGDDFDPVLSFDAKGRAVAAWWNESDGQGEVFVSIFLKYRWSSPVSVSAAGVDARYPALERDSKGRLTLSYETPAGVTVHPLRFDVPVTITDDINPNVWTGGDGAVSLAGN